jgi:hypothetical protein
VSHAREGSPGALERLRADAVEIAELVSEGGEVAFVACSQ